MATVNGEDGFTQLDKLNVTNNLKINGADVATPAADVVNINDESQLNLVSGRYELEPEKTYNLAAGLNLSHGFRASVGNTIYQDGVFLSAVTYLGTDDFIEVTTDAVELRALSVYIPNAKLLGGISGAEITETVIMNNVNCFECASIGEFSDPPAVIADTCAFFNLTDSGISFSSTITAIEIKNCFFNLSAANGSIAVDLGASVVDQLKINGNQFIGDPSDFAISGLPNNGNLPAGSDASCFGNTILGLTGVDGVQAQDTQWKFRDNNTVDDSRNAANGYLTALQTVIINTQGVFEAINGGNWATTISDKFTVSAAGVFTYIGVSDIDVLVVSSATLEKVGGQADLIALRLAVNGTTLTESEVSTKNTTPTSLTSQTLVRVSTGDTIALYVANLEADDNIEVSNANVSTIGY